jgi:hypothetical protein
MGGAIGSIFWGRRSFNKIERTAGTVKRWKAVVSSANGSQTDHGSSPFEKCQILVEIGSLGTTDSVHCNTLRRRSVEQFRLMADLAFLTLLCEMRHYFIGEKSVVRM